MGMNEGIQSKAPGYPWRSEEGRCFLQLFGYLNQKNKEINQVDIKKKRYS